MQNKKLVLAASLFSLGFSSAAIAHNNLDDRWYIAPTASYIWTDADRLASHNDYGLALGVGKAINQNFNVELKGFYNDFSHLESNTRNEYQWDAFGSSVDLQYYFNRNKLSPYAVIGAGYMNSEVQGKSTGGIIAEAGVGVAYKLCEHLSLRSDVRYRYNDNFNKALVPNDASTYNEMIVNVGVVIPFGKDPSKAKEYTPVPVAKPVSDDSDNDGVKNSADKCPETKAGVKVNLVGCDMGITLTGVNFNISSPALTLNAKSILDKLADEIKAYPNKKDIEIQGHASSDGKAKSNMILSQKRAESVVSYLKSKGVTNNLIAKGYGSTMPVADDAVKGGRDQNRRVDMMWK